MKNSTYAIMLLLFLSTPALIPMEPQKEEIAYSHIPETDDNEKKPKTEATNNNTTTKQSVISVDDCVNKVDAWINEEYKTYTIAPTFTLDYLLSGEKIATILTAVSDQIPTTGQTNELFKKLYTKNNLLKILIDKLIASAIKTIETVTADTIDEVYQPDRKHPYETLNHIPFWIKKYIIKDALDTFYTDKKLAEYKYILQGHTDTINHVNLGEIINQVASCSKDATARLWNIKTGNCDYILKHNASVERCSYNEDNSELVTAQQDSAIIELWNTKNGQHIKSIKYPVTIHHVTWRENTLLAAGNNNKCYLQIMTPYSEDLIMFFFPHTKKSTSDFYTSYEDLKVIGDKNSVILKINNRTLHLANLALKDSKNDYKKLKTLQASGTISDLSQLEGKQIRVDLKTKIKQLALTQGTI
jgi:WD40 repeat protein